MRALLSRLRPTLLTRVALGLAAVGLLPLLVSWFRIPGISRDAMYEQVLRTHTVAAKTTAERIDSFLVTRQALAHGAAESPVLATDPAGPAAQELLRSDLQAWAGLGVLAVAVLDAQGADLVRAQLVGVGPRVEAALRARGAGRVVADAGEPPVLRIAAPLPGGAGSLVLVCDSGPLWESVRPVEIEDADLVVATREGRRIAGSLPSLSGLPPALTRMALSGKLAGAASFPQVDGGILGAFAPVPESGWTVISVQPTRVAEAVANRMRERALLALGVAAVLVLGLSAAAWASVVRPIRRLASASSGPGGFGPRERTGDEIEDLRRTFEALQRGLTERRALEGVVLGRYQVVEPLGAGAMGAVFRGWDPRLQRAVALKTIRLSGDLAPERRRDLIDTLTREAVTVARLSHPNIVAVYDLEDAPEGAFIAMELVEGTNLERLLWTRWRLAPGEAVPLVAAIARGLAAAHDKGIVHRDIKPANVLLGRNGSIKVTDFGIAGVFAASAPSSDTVFGTPGYIPPESLQGGGHGKAGDLFSLGALLYTCLAGRQPFEAIRAEDVLLATLFGPVPSLRREVDGLPAEVESLVAALLERDPALRPTSAAAVAAELERIAAERGFQWSLDEGTGEEGRPGATGALPAQWVATGQIRKGTPLPA